MKVKKIDVAIADAAQVPAVLDACKVPFEPIATVNWSEYSYKPQVEFRIAHTADAYVIHYKVAEETVKAVYGEDMGKVWTDSCVEFFSCPATDGIYYNLECNCIGTVLLCAGDSRHDREHAPAEVLAQIKRWSSLGREAFAEKEAPATWEVALVVPFSMYFKHQVTAMDGKSITANFYKCGDELKTPHFLSWNPIGTEKPDFHRPEYFATLEME